MSALCCAIALIISLICWKLLKIFSYWSERGVTQKNMFPIFGDTLGLLFKTQSFTEMTIEFYNRFPRERYTGIYQFFTPTLLIKDPDLIKQILVKDFDNFSDHSTIIEENCDPIWTKNLFNMKGGHWKEMRATLSTTFTSSKIKRMFPLVAQCSEHLTSYLSEKQPGTIKIELKELFTRYASNVIASCVFGFENDSLRNPKNDFFVTGQNATDFTGISKRFLYLLYIGAPRIAKLLGLRAFSEENTRYYTKIVIDTIKYREENNVTRPDLIQLLMDLRKEKAAKNEPTLSDIELTSQAVIFIFAGYESLSTTMSFLAYELATNPDVQARLRDEIDETLLKCDGNLTFEAMQGMEYFNMVLSECLRKWPAIVVTDRISRNPYTITPETPNEKPVHLKKGDILWIPICALQNDDKYFPEPDKFIPERFSAENKKTINPSTYLPFGYGPRFCISSRFAQMEVKTLFCYLMSHYEIEVVDKTVVPVKLMPSFALNMKGDFWLGLKPRNNHHNQK